MTAAPIAFPSDSVTSDRYQQRMTLQSNDGRQGPFAGGFQKNKQTL
jgi:hypothetical protein